MGDDDTRRLVEENLRLVPWALARLKVYQYQERYDDLLQEGNIALIRAAAHYDPTLGKFTTYAARCIWGGVLKAFKRQKKFKVEIEMEDPIEEPVDADVSWESNDANDAEVLRLFRYLTEREKYILRRYHVDGITLDKIGSELEPPITREAVRQIKRKALHRLTSGLE